MVQLVHLKGAFSCTKAAWPHFRKQRFGRVINTASAAGLYGTHIYIMMNERLANERSLCQGTWVRLTILLRRWASSGSPRRSPVRVPSMASGPLSSLP
jgi:NAD(P)-dependent dehydrogenase (short-subunit alcohol dehydrogenase family)